MKQGYLLLIIILLVFPIQAICSYYGRERPFIAFIPPALFLLLTAICLLVLIYIKTYTGLVFMLLAVIFGVSAVLAFALALFFKCRHKNLNK